MVNYRRSRATGATLFFTVALRNRSADTLIRYVDVLRSAVMHEHALRPFAIEAMVVLPDHLHAVWTLPAGDADYSTRWRAIKSGFVRRLRSNGIALAANLKGEHAIWQRRFWEHQIRNETDLARHVDYVHINPLKHGLVERVVSPIYVWAFFRPIGRLKRRWTAPLGNENDSRIPLRCIRATKAARPTPLPHITAASRTPETPSPATSARRSSRPARRCRAARLQRRHRC